MTDVANPDDVTSETSEKSFGVEDIFFSRTDERGVIRSGNEVFRRVSGYDWGELIKAPHKIIRHDDMPKAVFHLLWEKLQSGAPVIAYVKNRSKDGGFYWVLAFATPAEDGYISVRIKPTSPLLETVGGVYAELVAEEGDDWRPDTHGHKALMERLKTIGFGSYEAFAAHVATVELTSRNAAMGIKSDASYEELLEISTNIKQLSEDVVALAEIFQRIRTTPVNMGIMASRIERAGGPISAISGIYSSMSNDIGAWLEGFMRESGEAFTRMDAEASNCLLTIASTEIQSEMLASFEKEAVTNTGFSRDEEYTRLEAQSRLSARKARASVAQIRTDATEIQNAIHVLKRHVMSLSSTRVLCEIESAKLTERSESLEGVVGQLASFQDEIEALHKKIEAGTQAILSALTVGRGPARPSQEADAPVAA